MRNRTLAIIGSATLLLLLALARLAVAQEQEDAYLGVYFRNLNAEEAKALGWSAPRGVRVATIINPIPSEKGNLKVGDIILTAEGIEAAGFYHMDRLGGRTYQPRLDVLLRLKRPGERVELIVFRDGEERKLTATLVARIPAPPPPACKGRDLLAELERTDPTGYAAIIATANSIPNSKGLLWRIQKAELADSFLFGTAHVTDDRVTRISASVKEAFAHANRVALENDPLTVGKSIRQLGTLGKYGDGRSLKTELPLAEYLAFTKMLKKIGIDDGEYDETRPWLIRLPMPCEQARAKYGMKVLDERLYEDAMTRGVPVVGLENIEEKLRLRAAISTFTQLVTLVSEVRQSEQAEDQLETIIQIYVRRDLGPIGPLGRYWDEKAGMPLSAIEENLNYHIRRNYTMRDAAQPLLARGGLFIAVGVAHLQGPEGLVELFRQSGYQLSVVE